METSESKPKYSKYCLVPHCKSTSIRTPEKLFISLPVGLTTKLKKRRILWLHAMRRRKNDISETTRGFVCEDHFNLEEDMENYMRYKMVGGKIILKDHVVPHIFNCQPDRKRSSQSERVSTVKRARKTIVSSLLCNAEASTAEDGTGTGSETKIVTSSVNLSKELLPTNIIVNDFKKFPPSRSNNVTQTEARNVIVTQRSVSVQHRPFYRSKFVQTEHLNVTTTVSAVNKK